MYRKSFFIVLLALMVMGLLATGTRYVMAIPGVTGLPSSYDPKIPMMEAMQTSTKPLLIEFYSDTCGTCQVVTPWTYKLKDRFANDLTFVMVDVNDPQNAQVSQIFGIEYIPAIFVFDAKHMAKAQVSTSAYANSEALGKGIQDALDDVKQKVDAKTKKGATSSTPQIR